MIESDKNEAVFHENLKEKEIMAEERDAALEP